MIQNVQTYKIPFDRGGLTGNTNFDQVDPFMMIAPSRNINLFNKIRETRGGTSILANYPIVEAPQILGVFDYTLGVGTQYIIAAASDGNLYKDHENTINTGMSESAFYNFEIADGLLFICDGVTIPQVWDGGEGDTADITNPASDWSATSPFQMTLHGRLNSLRLWALTKDRLYASKNGDVQDFSDLSVFVLPIDTADNFGLVGMIEFGQELIVFGKKKAYRILDVDIDVTNWGYMASQWEGGVAHRRLIVRTPNDLIAMTEDGEIYSVTAANTYGDYKAASLTRPADMHTWIKENVDLSQISKFHAVYDPTLRVIKFFMVKLGYTSVNMALVYHVDRPPKEAWMLHDNDSVSAHGYQASSSAVVRVSAGRYKIYTGDYAGNIWQTENTTYNDNGFAYVSSFTTPYLNCDDPRSSKKFVQGWVSSQPKGNYNAQVGMIIDGINQINTSVSLAGSGGALMDSFILGTDILGGQTIVDNPFEIGNIGKRINFELFSSIVNQPFSMSSMAIDYVPLGPNVGKT